ncbi:MAG: hypothetical protein PHR68_05695 [Candidatus Gracilibacteria bacterium]|nr:hypothetical protein [Candidatus Gracilibacteria bacterium]
MFGNKENKKREYRGEALLKEGNKLNWYKYFIDKERIVIEKSESNLYYPLNNLFIRINGRIYKINTKGEVIKEFDEFLLKEALQI